MVASFLTAKASLVIHHHLFMDVFCRLSRLVSKLEDFISLHTTSSLRSLSSKQQQLFLVPTPDWNVLNLIQR